MVTVEHGTEELTVPQYGFLIDHRKCIGCHACTVACKSENDVPLGNFRTWVKYTEKGAFPDVRRHFTVLRCNHCDDAPCVEVCPVEALHKRPDAIVDLDRDLCIGCASCTHACPYDSIYMNEGTGTAEKCHFCAHRTERGMAPACVVVCPEQAIVAGDVSNPSSEIATLLESETTSRRRLDKATRPRVWYVDALEESLTPGCASEPEHFIWSDRQAPPPPVVPGFEPTADLLNVLDVAHPPTWGHHIYTYLLTKNIAAGIGMVAPFLGLLGVSDSWARDVLPEVLILLFMAITMVYLIIDLGKPSRFIKILTHPNMSSWLVKGAFILMAFGLTTAATLALRLFEMDGAAKVARFIGLPLALLTSGYSAWLFAQCKGRELWCEKGTFAHLVTRAAALGGGFVLLLPAAGFGPSSLFVSATLISLLVSSRRGWPKEKAAARVARHHAADGSRQLGRILGVMALALGLMAGFASGSIDLATRILGVASLLTGQFLCERAWIRNGQEFPNS